MTIQILPPSQAPDAVSVLCDAFRDYPVMRYVLGEDPHYDRRLLTLVDFFVAGRVLRGEPVLGIPGGEGSWAAAAIVSLPGPSDSPEALNTKREAVWAELGLDARRRYEAYGAATQPFSFDSPHHHLNMIGVRRGHAGTGLGRQLLEAVHDLSTSDANSSGVSLTTENPRNVGLYEHFGYRVVGRAQVAEELETWGMFRGRG